MFLMTGFIRVELSKSQPGNSKKVTVKFPISSVKWNVSIDNFSDTASFIIPAMCRMRDSNAHYSNINVLNTGDVFSEGDKVEIYAGYDQKNDLQFKGFISRVNFRIPIEIECEGYSYQLRRKMINKTFGKTTVKDVLNHLIADTDIRLSDKCPNRIDFEPYPFKNYTGIQVLSYLKEKYLLTIFFEYDKLYVGWRATYKGNMVKMRLNWNVVDHKQLLFSTYTGSLVHIELESRAKTGIKNKVKANNIVKPGNVKQVKTIIQSATDKQFAANDRQLIENKKGYSGSLTGFLKPFARPGDSVQIIDKKHSERNGMYFIDSIEGSFGPEGGRQKLGIAFSVSANS